ncbi:hypothetical protein F4825DRAFT_451733 [Nemania diffusa]|nr:hypothetical protein F4825DRAFT_451733 [Nemania diffusa]
MLNDAYSNGIPDCVSYYIAEQILDPRINVPKAIAAQVIMGVTRGAQYPIDAVLDTTYAISGRHRQSQLFVEEPGQRGFHSRRHLNHAEPHLPRIVLSGTNHKGTVGLLMMREDPEYLQNYLQLYTRSRVSLSVKVVC